LLIAPCTFSLPKALQRKRGGFGLMKNPPTPKALTPALTPAHTPAWVPSPQELSVPNSIPRPPPTPLPERIFSPQPMALLVPIKSEAFEAFEAFEMPTETAFMKRLNDAIN